MVRTYGFPGCFERPTGDLCSQPSSRNVHVEACRPREYVLTKDSPGAAPRPPPSSRLRRTPQGWDDRHTMELRPLGTTGTKVSPLCLGAMMFGAWGNTDHDESIRIIHRALDAGINFIDTADVYARGESEEIVGRALAGRRDQVVLASKVHGGM